MDRSFVDFYIGPVWNGDMHPVYPAARQAQLESTKNEVARRQRYSVWKLLEYAVAHSLGLSLEQLTLECKNGKWSCKECFFSLSHCDGAVAVAVSDGPVGVDIEPADRAPSPGIARKILTEAELAIYNTLPEESRQSYLLEKWCASESLFKGGFDGMFQPRQEPSVPYISGVLTVAGKNFQYAVATPCPEDIKLFTDVELK